MVCAIRQTCHYLLEVIKKICQVAFSDEKRHSLRSLNRWAREWCGFLQVSIWERQAELLVCKKGLLSGLIAEPGLEVRWRGSVHCCLWNCPLGTPPQGEQLGCAGSHIGRLGTGEWRRESEPCLGTVHSWWQKWILLLTKRGLPSVQTQMDKITLDWFSVVERAVHTFPGACLGTGCPGLNFSKLLESLGEVMENWTLPQAAPRHLAGPRSESKSALSEEFWDDYQFEGEAPLC